jgi:transcriptional regulator with XRE-family HTH domain
MFFMVAVPIDLTVAVARAVEEARQSCGLKLESLASLMGISREQLSQELRGQGVISLSRLVMASRDVDGRAFWLAFLPALGELVGVEDLDAVAAQLRRVVAALDTRVMAKADLSTHVQRKTA